MKPTADRGDRDPFVIWLRHVAGKVYHAPPPTPVETLWPGIVRGWTGGRSAGVVPDVLEEAAAYHAPPPPPVEEMWKRIEGAWRLRRAAPGAGAEPVPAAAALEAPSGGTRGRGLRFTRILRRAVGLAAVLALGVGLGRLSLREPARPVVEGGEGVRAGTPLTMRPGPGEEARPSGAEPARGGSPGTHPRLRLPEPRGGTEPLAVAAAGRDGRPAPADRGPEDGEPGAADSETREARRAVLYRTAAADYLSRTEALLTSFRDDPAGAVSDAAISEWARDLLTETRLFLDWGAGEDPALRPLLQQLELVLEQVVRAGGDGAEREREIVVQGMEEQAVLARLRAAIPPGAGEPTGT